MDGLIRIALLKCLSLTRNRLNNDTIKLKTSLQSLGNTEFVVLVIPKHEFVVVRLLIVLVLQMSLITYRISSIWRDTHGVRVKEQNIIEIWRL